MPAILDARRTAAHLPWSCLVDQLVQMLSDASVKVPPRMVQPLPGGGSLFVMPALDSHIAITKLITFTPGNAAKGLPAIQGDVVVFDVSTGQRSLVLDGPTVTARRTAAVSVLAAQRLAANTTGPLLVVGAGVQGKSHIEAFADVLKIREVVIASRSEASAQALALHAQSIGLRARIVKDANAALADCSLAVTCTPASSVVLSSMPRKDAFISAVGAFTPTMVELSAELCRHFATQGCIVIDTTDAVHEAGDLLQAGLDVGDYKTLGDALQQDTQKSGSAVLFKSCGWAGWDLAAARVAMQLAALG